MEVCARMATPTQFLTKDNICKRCKIGLPRGFEGEKAWKEWECGGEKRTRREAKGAVTGVLWEVGGQIGRVWRQGHVRSPRKYIKYPAKSSSTESDWTFGGEMATEASYTCWKWMGFVWKKGFFLLGDSVFSSGVIGASGRQYLKIPWGWELERGPVWRKKVRALRLLFTRRLLGEKISGFGGGVFHATK